MRDGMGTAWMKLLSYSNRTKRYLFPLLDGTVKCPVWSVNILPDMGIQAGYTCLDLGSNIADGVESIFVARTLCPMMDVCVAVGGFDGSGEI